MLFVFIFVGAILAAFILQEFEFTFLGAFLGFLLWRLGQLSDQFKSLASQVDKLQSDLRLNGLKEATSDRQTQIKDSAIKSAQVLPEQDKSDKTTYNGKVGLEANKSVVNSISPISTAKSSLNQQSASSESTVQAPKFDTTARTGHKETVSSPTAREYKPDIISKLIQTVINYFTQGNIVVRVGAVILFFGVAFLVKYAAESNLISIELRLMAVAVGGIGLLIFGWKFRTRNQDYGLILQGTAVGILYLTLFAAFRLYGLIPGALAFPLLILFSGLAMMLAVLQDSRALAVLSTTGGFLAPVLASTGSGSHISLFSYYAVLNLGIFAVAWFKSWRILNLLGFAFTFIIGSAWGITKYQPDNFLSSEFFLVLFFLLYTAIALLFATKHQPKLKGYADATLIFGLPLVAFSLQAAMVEDYEFGLAWSAFALGAFYLLTAYLILKRESLAHLKVIAEAFVALGIIFTSLVIPFALDGHWTAASWAIEGAGLIWLGLKQDRWFAKYFGTLIQLGGGIIFLTEINYNTLYPVNTVALFDAQLLGIIFVALGALFSSFQIWKNKKSLKRFEAVSRFGFLIWGLLWWYLGGVMEITDHFSNNNELYGLAGFICFSSLLFYAIERKYYWTMLVNIIWVTLPFSILIALAFSINFSHLFMDYGAIAWLSIIGSFYFILFDRDRRAIQLARQSDQDNYSSQSMYLSSNLVVSADRKLRHNIRLPAALPAIHIIALLGVITLSFSELVWLVEHKRLTTSAWGLSLYGFLGGLWILAINKFKFWPVTNYPMPYVGANLSVLMVGTIFWSFFLNFSHSGLAQPLSYVPFLNPLDIVQGLLLIFIYQSIHLQRTIGFQIGGKVIVMGAALFIFIWLNIIFLRTIHAYAGIDYSPNALFSSFVVQTSISIFWTLLGLAGTIFGARRGSRQIWIYSAALIGVVVLKLFVIDLDNSSSIERIVSFVVVGLLLLTVGYFSPLPEKNKIAQ